MHGFYPFTVTFNLVESLHDSPASSYKHSFPRQALCRPSLPVNIQNKKNKKKKLYELSAVV